MNNFNRIMLSLGLVASLLLGLYPSTDSALSAVAPVVSTLPAITAKVGTPVRLTSDSAGNIYVSDPGAGGILQYNSAGALMQKITTPIGGNGLAIALNGDLLVAQRTYVAAIQPNGTERTRFGSFVHATGIAVDPSGNVYVTDGRSNNIKKFSSAYTLLATSTVALQRPSGIAYEKAAGLLYVANSLSGKITVCNTSDLSENFSAGPIGTFGYDPTHATVKFTYPQGIAFEYGTGNTLSRIYVSDLYQSSIQVLDGATRTWIAEIGGYGFIPGKLFVPSDVLFDASNSINKRIFVANGGGTLAVFGIDNMQPTNIQVTNPTLTSLTVSWAKPTTPGFAHVHIYRSATSGQTGGLVADNQTGISYVDSGLTAGTTYYYTVRAVDTTGTEYANTQPVSGTTRVNYALKLTTVGFGTINGSASVGENATNTVNILDNTLVTLTAYPNMLKSVFSGWTGDCASFGMNETCQITMDGAKDVTANFEAQQPFYVDGFSFDTLQAAYDFASNNSVIEVMAGTWPANSVNATMVADRAITVTIKGGYDSQFTEPPTAGTTVIIGRINLKAGRINIDKVKIHP